MGTIIRTVGDYFIECPHCETDVYFNTADIDGLDEWIAGERRDAGRETELQFEGMIDPDDHPIQPRTIHDLAAAIRRGDMAEAELLLDRVADELGLECANAAQVGRYSSLARAA